MDNDELAAALGRAYMEITGLDLALPPPSEPSLLRLEFMKSITMLAGEEVVSEGVAMHAAGLVTFFCKPEYGRGKGWYVRTRVIP